LVDSLYGSAMADDGACQVIPHRVPLALVEAT
jgi:hypothetical protein